MLGFSDSAENNRYELAVDDTVSLATYRDQAGVRFILHVETPPEARGKGHAARLLDAIVEDARARGLKLRAVCSYAAAYFQRHPNTADVMA
jgi:predicted GNAT family acetyltransferase